MKLSGSRCFDHPRVSCADREVHACAATRPSSVGARQAGEQPGVSSLQLSSSTKPTTASLSVLTRLDDKLVREPAANRHL
jgi:hypothetical protein